MSVREKLQWATLVLTFVAFAWYFAAYPWGQIGGPSHTWAGRWMILAVAFGISISLGLVATIVAIRNPAEVRLREDERERVLHWRGTHAAYYPLIVGIWVGIVLGFYGYSSELVTNVLLASFAGAEMIRLGRQIQLSRQG